VRRRPLPDDILWLDPLDIGLGRLTELHLRGHDEIVPLGVVLYSHLRLKLQLRARGFTAKFHDYDWRRDIAELGRSLAERIQGEPCDRVMIVAHSMGGLIGRAALRDPALRKVQRLILLGTPNSGSFAPLQALRGTYAVVRKIAQLVNRGSAELLSNRIFSSFPSLYQMLPTSACSDGLDLFDSRQWPASGPRPDSQLLRQARAAHDRLARDDERMLAIVGIGQETVTSAMRRKDDFIYTVTRHGDGTVPALSAALPGSRNFFAAVPHSELTRDRVVAAAICDLLRHGTTRRLAARWRTHSRAEAHVSDTQLRRLHRDKVDWARLEPQARRQFLQNLNEPPRLRLRVKPGRGKRSCRKVGLGKRSAARP